MNKIKKAFVSFGLIIVLVITLIPQMSMASDIDLTEQIEFVDEFDVSNEISKDTHTVLQDVIITTELLTNNVINITLENTGAFTITEWAVAYEASYDILDIENAELVMNNEVKEFKAVEGNNILESGEMTTISLAINGIYSEDTVYRVYGICKSISEKFSVTDFITYNSITGETTFNVHSNENIQTTIDILSHSEINNENEAMFQEILAPLVLIDEDDDKRKKVSSSGVKTAPYNRIVHLDIDWGSGKENSVGTGFMISNKHILTAAHCLYDSETGKKAKSITAYFEIYENIPSTPKKAIASSWSYCATYPLYPTLPDYDWGCIELSAATSQGKFTLGYKTPAQLVNTYLTVSGYSYEGNTGKLYLYRMRERPLYATSGYIMYLIDTLRAQSGSPVYDDSYVVYGIHSGSGTYEDANGQEHPMNTACRLTPEIINLLIDNGWYSY